MIRSEQVTGAAARPAFILFADPHKVGPYLTDLQVRDLTVLLVVGPSGPTLAQVAIAQMNTASSPYPAVAEVEVREGRDISGIVDQAMRWSREYDIVGVLVTAEIFVEPGAVVCDLLGLPQVGLRAARVCRNKLLQRQYLHQWSPQSVLVTAPTDGGSDRVFGERTAGRIAEQFNGAFPLVVKPLTLDASIGVRLIGSQTALADALTDLQPAAELLVEQRVIGREYNVDTIVVAGEPLSTMITQKGTNETDSEYFVELTHTTPPTNLREGEARLIIDVQAAVIDRLDFETGMAHAEYRVTEDSEVFLMEIAARAPGDACLPLYELATGQAVEPVLIDAALGRSTNYVFDAQRRARQIYFEHAPGVLRDVGIDWPEFANPRWLAETGGFWPLVRAADKQAPAELRELLVLKSRGDRLLPLTESSTRAVSAIFDAPLDFDIALLDARVRNAVTIATDDAAGDGLRSTSPVAV